MSQPHISVLLPVFNGARHIATAVRSILDQTFESLELVIVDDGSTDTTVDIIREFFDPRIRLFTLVHSGIAGALNYGLGHCRADIVARMDADDISLPSRLQDQWFFLKENPDICAVSCLVDYEKKDQLPDGYREFVRWMNGLVNVNELQRNRFVESPFAHPSMMFRKNLIEKYGKYSTEKLPEDYELWLRWYSHGEIIGKIEKSLLIWNDRKSRLSRIHDNYSEEGFYHVKAKYFLKWYHEYGAERRIFVWGRGNVMRRRLRHFTTLGLPVTGFIDITRRDSGSVIHYTEVSGYRDSVILCFVADKTGKGKISFFLNDQGFAEGTDYFHVV